MALKLVQNLPQNTATQPTPGFPNNIYFTVEAITELARLENDWDSYGATSPTKDACIGSVQLAYELLMPNTPNPDVFPVPNGNIQFEWSCYGFDIEIEIESNRKCYVSYENLNTGESWDSEFTFDLSHLSELMEEFTKASLYQAQLQIVH